MIRARRASASIAPFRLLYSVRTSDDVLGHDPHRVKTERFGGA